MTRINKYAQGSYPALVILLARLAIGQAWPESFNATNRLESLCNRHFKQHENNKNVHYFRGVIKSLPRRLIYGLT